MPTGTKAFFEIAARHGGVDPTDVEAVERWFANELPRLPREKLEELLEELLRLEGVMKGGVLRRKYPYESHIPALSVTPPATLPLLAVGLGVLFRWIFRWGSRDPSFE